RRNIAHLGEPPAVVQAAVAWLVKSLQVAGVAHPGAPVGSLRLSERVFGHGSLPIRSGTTDYLDGSFTSLVNLTACPRWPDPRCPSADGRNAVRNLRDSIRSHPA